MMLKKIMSKNTPCTHKETNDKRYEFLSDKRPWIGVDLDGTLARYDGWGGLTDIGEPIPAMIERVKIWIASGNIVKIFTARISDIEDEEELDSAVYAIQQWCLRNIGVILPITNVKDYAMIQLWDDRAIQVVFNTGKTLAEVVHDTQHQIDLPKP